MSLTIFLAGIMQGSHAGTEMHGQDYRDELRRLLTTQWPQAEIYCPYDNHQESIDYQPNQAREVFLNHNAMCREVDLLIAYVPQASMGTAIEMWEAAQAGKLVVAISPLAHNWAIRFCSHRIYSTLPEFAEALESGELEELLTMSS